MFEKHKNKIFSMGYCQNKWIVKSIIETYDGTNADDVKQKLKNHDIRFLKNNAAVYPFVERIIYKNTSIQMDVDLRIHDYDFLCFWAKKILRGHVPFKNFKVSPYDKALIEKFISLGGSSVVDIIRYISNLHRKNKKSLSSKMCTMCNSVLTRENYTVNGFKLPNGTDKTIIAIRIVCETCVNKIYDIYKT